MNDLTRLLQTLQPTPDGESAVRHRTALVDAVNADGTVDLDFDGTIIPSVSVLDGAVVGAGDVVQVAAWAGDLLVLGAARTAPSGARGVLGFASTASTQTGITAETTLNNLSVSVTVGANRRIRVIGSGSFGNATSGGRYIVDLKEGATYLGRPMDYNAATNEVFRYEGSAILTPSAGAHTYIQRLRRITGTGTGGSIPDANNPAFTLVEDIGPA